MAVSKKRQAVLDEAQEIIERSHLSANRHFMTAAYWRTWRDRLGFPAAILMREIQIKAEEWTKLNGENPETPGWALRRAVALPTNEIEDYDFEK